MLTLRTERLVLIAATLDLLRAEQEGLPLLAGVLGAELPSDWPPPLNDARTLRWSIDLLERRPESVGWGAWYFLLARGTAPPVAVGCGGFRGAPDDDGSVEVGYSVLESQQGRGYATEAVRALIEWASTDVRVREVTAHTLPSLTASIRVLEKCGFVLIGVGAEEGTIRYRLSHSHEDDRVDRPNHRGR